MLLLVAACALRYDPLATPVPLPLDAPWNLTVTADVGATGTAHVVMRHTGSRALRIDELALVQLGHFEIAGAAVPPRLRPGEELGFDVHYTPPDLVQRSAAVVLRTDAGVHTLSLSGRAPEDRSVAPGASVLGVLRGGTDLGAVFAGSARPEPSEALPGLSKLGKEPAVPPPGDPIILGGMDKGAIDAVIRRHTPEIEACWRNALVYEPTLAGRVTIRFVVVKDGTVSTAGVKQTTFPAGRVEQCLIESFVGYRFPEPKGGGLVIVAWPLVFAPE